MLVETSVIRASSLSSMTLTGLRLPSERQGPMRTTVTGLAAIAVGSPRIWQKRALYVALCTTAVFFGWLTIRLAIRLSVTYLPPDDVVWLSRNYQTVATVAAVRCAPVDLPRLQERVRRTAQAVLPSVVAVRHPFEKPLEGKNYASGVIITADGIVLSQGTSATGSSRGDGNVSTRTIRRLAQRATGRQSFSTTAVSVRPNCWARIALMMSLSCGCSSLVRIRTCPSAPRLPSQWATGFSRSVARSDTGRADSLPCGSAA